MPSDLLKQSDPARRAPSAIDDVVDHLMVEFGGLLPAHRVREVVVIGRRDLVREVPTEALPEFLHRLARQRLTDLRTKDIGTVEDMVHA